MVKSVVHAYPWDLIGDPDAVARYQDLGIDAIALAASYHTVRAATPLHPSHRMVDARHAAFYLPVRSAKYGRLVPAEPSWVDGSGSFGAAAALVRAAGLPVYAWTVLTHNSRLGDLHPDVTVVNAFGDRYPYALCTAQPDVVEYTSVLVSEVLELGAPDGIILEACGPLGFFHGGHHEKTDGTDWNAVQQKLLSLCFCSACTALYADPDALREAVRAGVDRGASSVEEALGALAEDVQAVRTGVVRSLRQRLVSEIRAAAPSIRVGMHVTADPWGTGPFATVAGGVDADVDVLTTMCWPGPEIAVPGIEALRAAAPDTRIAAYVLGLPPKPADGAALSKEWLAYVDAGVEEFHLYHGGLASAARLEALREAVTAVSR
ncbi:hypothetical protein SAMN04488074_105448 [Lentzea albidocapillata subsp. violacea]|uniref:Alanine-rich protein n=1 Tax=Lentzea albidocapillata subsp. violacea TaxID=128104 RepID=A0A1G9BXC3_9PSEU|nr:hypothetical protein [Lentzea albidocapillata]SDK44040.1 hypothetical protein SAMN04488074_105448 [Lentzea albidocapillata subsp. violacea]